MTTIYLVCRPCDGSYYDYHHGQATDKAFEYLSDAELYINAQNINCDGDPEYMLYIKIINVLPKYQRD